MEVFGAIFVTLFAIYAITKFIGYPVLLLGFGGVNKEHIVWMIVGSLLSIGVGWIWWTLVGTHIHLTFG